MMKPETVRSPRGAKPLAKLFFDEINALAPAAQTVVAKAALSLIRDQMKLRAEKAKTDKLKAKAKAAMPVKALKVAKTTKAAKTSAVKSVSKAKTKTTALSAARVAVKNPVSRRSASAPKPVPTAA